MLYTLYVEQQLHRELFTVKKLEKIIFFAIETNEKYP
jgi:hypothetical protein